jgi:hypothetical protein
MGAINTFHFFRAMENTFVFRYNKSDVRTSFFLPAAKVFKKIQLAF